MNSESESIQENTITWSIEAQKFEDLSPVQQLSKIKPTYTFEKAALTLQNSKGLLKKLNDVLFFLKSEKENLIFGGMNGACETFFVEILKDRNNLLSNFLDEECKIVCKTIYDCLNTTDDKFEVLSGFRQNVDSDEMSLMYFKNFKLTEAVKIPMGRKPKKAKSRTGKMSRHQKKLLKKCDSIAQLSRDFIQGTLHKLMNFVKDCTQASVTFHDLQIEQFHFVNHITGKKWTNRLGHILDPDLMKQVFAFTNYIWGKKNWSLNICQGKIKENSLRDITFEKRPNFGRDTFKEPNALNMLSEDVVDRQALPRHVKLMVDLSTPVVSDNALKIMKCMGWEGGALGIRGNGITEPIMPQINRVIRSGLGHGVSEKRHVRKYVPTNFLVTLFERILLLITKGGDEINMSLETKMHNKDKGYIVHVMNMLNRRHASAVGDYGDKYTVMKILEVMVEDPQLRLILYLYNDKKIRIIKAKNLQAIPEYVPGSDITQYVDTLITSFGPVIILDLTKKGHMYTVMTLLLDLVLNNCESKTYISPQCFTKKQVKFILNMVNHVNIRKKYGGAKVESFLFDKVLQNVKGFFLEVNFDRVGSECLPQNRTESNYNSKNAFTIRKIYNKQYGIYRNVAYLINDQSKPSVESNKESLAGDEISHQDLTDDGISDNSAVLYDSTDDELESFYDVEELYNRTGEESSSDVIRADGGRKSNDNNDLDEAELSNNELMKDKEPATSTLARDKLLIALTSCKSVGSPIIEPSNTMENDDTSVCNNANDDDMPAIDKELIIENKSSMKQCTCKLSGDEKNLIDKETQTTVITGVDEEFLIAQTGYEVEERPCTSKSDRNTDSVELFDDSVTNIYDDMTDFDDFQDADSDTHREKTKFNSPDEWEQLEQDIFNLRHVLENEFVNSMKAETTEANLNNLKRYKADLEKFGSPNDTCVKTIKIVPLNYPNETIDKKTVLKIHSLILEAVTETEQPLLKCHGVKDGALLYTCFTEDSYKFLNKLLIHTKTKIVHDVKNQRKPRLFMRFINCLELSPKDVFSKLELFNKNKGVVTKEWEVERCWDSNDFSIFVLQVDQVSFEVIKNNGFSLFFGVDQAEFSVGWR